MTKGREGVRDDGYALEELKMRFILMAFAAAGFIGSATAILPIPR